MTTQTQTASPPTPPAGTRSFRDALGRYATGVAVVAAATDDGPVGLAVNSFTSVSLDPPLVAFCPMLTSSSWARMRPSGGFAVSLLRAHHEPVARLFSQKNADRFGSHDWERSPGGHPVLAEALGWVDATIEQVTTAGDHDVVIARATDWSEAFDGAPLVFFGGRYTSLA